MAGRTRGPWGELPGAERYASGVGDAQSDNLARLGESGHSACDGAADPGRWSIFCRVRYQALSPRNSFAVASHSSVGAISRERASDTAGVGSAEASNGRWRPWHDSLRLRGRLLSAATSHRLVPAETRLGRLDAKGMTWELLLRLALRSVRSATAVALERARSSAR